MNQLFTNVNKISCYSVLLEESCRQPIMLVFILLPLTTVDEKEENKTEKTTHSVIISFIYLFI